MCISMPLACTHAFAVHACCGGTSNSSVLTALWHQIRSGIHLLERGVVGHLWTTQQLHESARGVVAMQLAKVASQASKEINVRRKARGLQPRPARACVIGFPNVGKSALINRLLKRRACDSAPKPGVTRSLHWLRIGGNLDLLDAPGGALSVTLCLCYELHVFFMSLFDRLVPSWLPILQFLALHAGTVVCTLVESLLGCLSPGLQEDMV